MRTFWTIILAAVMAMCWMPASALIFTFDNGGGDGSITVNSFGSTILFVMVGDASGDAQPTIRRTQYTSVADQHYVISGAFTYETADFSASNDPFGTLSDGSGQQLTNDFGPLRQLGVFNFVVTPGETFGWYIDSLHFSTSAATVGVQANAEIVPLPPGFVLLSGAILGVVLLRAKRRGEHLSTRRTA